MSSIGELVDAQSVKIFVYRGLGYSQREIASMINVSQQTVSYHCRSMREKSEKIGPMEYFQSLKFTSSNVEATPAEVNTIEEKFKILSEKMAKEWNAEDMEKRIFIKINTEHVKLFDEHVKMFQKLENKMGFDTAGEYSR